MAALKRAVVFAAVLASASCTEPPVGIPAGTYVATHYTAGPTPIDHQDMLALGISWTLIVGDDRSVIDKWHISYNGMVSNTTRTGIVHDDDGRVSFAIVDGGDRILTERVWAREGDKLTATGQVVDGVSANIQFTRQP
jgi:hypothetical protein